jgi:hypothetical protein
MVRSAQATAIVEIEWCTTITQFNDVVGVYAMVWLCLAASVSVVDSLALTTSTSDNMSTPTLELRCAVDRVNAPWWQLGSVGVGGPHQGGKGS